MFQAYRAIRKFEWRGWTLAPLHQSEDIPRERYGGDVWIVEAGHPRLDAMMRSKFAMYDSSLDVDDLLKDDYYSRLTKRPQKRGKK